MKTVNKTKAELIEELEKLKRRNARLEKAELRHRQAASEKTRIEEAKRKKAENKIKESENRFRGAFESAAVGASMASLKGQFIKVNRFLCDMLGYSEDELLSKTFSDVTHPDDVWVGWDAAKKLISGELTHTAFEKRYVRKDGQLINVLISPTVIRDNNGNPLHFFALFQDVTERKMAEEERNRSLREKEVLLREIHHRVKNNLAIISSMFSLQSRRTKDEGAREMLRESQGRIMSMALVHEKLYRSANLAKIDFRDYARELASELLSSYGSGRIGLDVCGDEVFMEIDTLIPCGLILNELLTNSIKHAFSDVERPEIRINIIKVAEGDIELIVGDNGRGLPPDKDLEKSKTLGFQIVAALLRQLKGSLELEAEKGTVFRIILPLAHYNV